MRWFVGAWEQILKRGGFLTESQRKRWGQRSGGKILKGRGRISYFTLPVGEGRTGPLRLFFSNQYFSFSTPPSNPPPQPWKKKKTTKNLFYKRGEHSLKCHIPVAASVCDSVPWWGQNPNSLFGIKDGELIGVLWLWVAFTVHQLKYMEPTDWIFLYFSLVSALY